MTFPEMSLSRSEFGGVWDKERKKRKKAEHHQGCQFDFHRNQCKMPQSTFLLLTCFFI